MAARIHELRTQRAALAKEANTALEKVRAAAKSEDRTLTAEERAADDAYNTRLAVLDEDTALEETKMNRERMIAAAPSVSVGAPRAEQDPKRGFDSHVGFFTSVMKNRRAQDVADVSDERLQTLAVQDEEEGLAFVLPSGFRKRAAVGSDEQGEYSDTYGGFAVPKSRALGLLAVGFEGDPTAGLTQNVPMATPSVEIMARTDKDHSSSVSGGFTVARRAEAVTFSASRMALEMVTLKAATLVGLAYATEEILMDSAISFAAMIDAGFRLQMGAHVLNEKIRGLGGDQYIGALNADCAVSVAKETNQAADTINYKNVLKMRARCWGYGNAVWLANHDCLPELAQMSLAIGTGGSAVFVPGSFGATPDTLLGRPIIFSEYLSTVGDLGDIILVNWSQYLEGTYQPIQSAESIHVRFVNHEKTFKLWTRNCGAPWWRTYLTPNKGTNYLSPIITLAERG